MLYHSAVGKDIYFQEKLLLNFKLSTNFILYTSIILREQNKSQTAVYVIFSVLILGTFSVFKYFIDHVFEDYANINIRRKVNYNFTLEKYIVLSMEILPIIRLLK
jgi:hypothetical protein